MKNTKPLEQIPYNKILVVLYIITGSLSNFGAIDILAPQWIYLCVINILTAFYLAIEPNNIFFKSLKKVSNINFFIVVLFYLLINILSLGYAINISETLINLPRVINTWTAVFLIFCLLISIKNKLHFVSNVFVIFVSFELISYYNDLFTVLPKEGLRVIAIKGFAGNKNITAASIAFKIPFIFYFLLSKKRYLVLLSSFLLFISFLSISLIEARAAILSTIIITLLFIAFNLLAVFQKKIKFSDFNKTIALIILPVLFSFLINNILTETYKKGSINDTIGRISFTKESSNGRFDYWSDALNYTLKNPFMSSGLGNWKIASIKEGKNHISGYTVPYHAHNDFIHVFTETGIPGGIIYLSIFALLLFYAIDIVKLKIKNEHIQAPIILLPLIVYTIDAALNFPVARPLMQSSFAIYSALLISLYTTKFKIINSYNHPKLMGYIPYSIIIFLLPLLLIHIISYNSLRKQGLLLYEFNNAQYNMTIDQLDEISHTFPNLTETAMPIKAIKARYYYLQGKKDLAHEMATKGAKDNPYIFFGENLKSQFFFQEGNIDSAYVYAKKAFDGLPNNMPHYDMYMKTLVSKKLYNEIDEAFERIIGLGGNDKLIWTIYIRSLAQTRSLGDPFAMSKAAEAYNLFPNDETIFVFYRILTYGQSRVVEAENLYKKGMEFFDTMNYQESASYFEEAFDKDPLQYVYSLNSGLANYESKSYDRAIKFFELSINSKDQNIVEKAMRYKALSLLYDGKKSQACAMFLNLKNKFPKRMHQQEFTKFCLQN